MLFVQAVGASGHSVTVTKTSGESADGASILSVLALAAGHGEEVTITVEGDNAEAVAQQLGDLVASNLDAS
jgi:phosphocarrier protein HPr